MNGFIISEFNLSNSFGIAIWFAILIVLLGTILGVVNLFEEVMTEAKIIEADEDKNKTDSTEN